MKPASLSRDVPEPDACIERFAFEKAKKVYCFINAGETRFYVFFKITKIVIAKRDEFNEKSKAQGRQRSL